MSELIKPTFYHCRECGIVMIRAEWISGDYCWGCRCFKPSNWIPKEEVADE